MKEIPVSILGTDYIVKVGKRKEVGIGKNYNGGCHSYCREITVEHSMRGCELPLERNIRTCNVVAHEVFHAYVHESGLDLPEDVEEKLALWYEKMWYKMSETISDVIGEIPFTENTNLTNEGKDVIV